MPRTLALAASLALVPALALVGCSAVAAQPAGTTITAAAEAGTASALWDPSVLHTIDLDVEPSALEEALSAYLESGEKVWVEAAVTIDGVRYEQVGIKLKGNSSLREISADTDPATIPWRIRLDKYVDDQSWDGETDLVVRGNSSETSLNEAVALGLLDAAGLASQAAIGTAFSVNGGDAQLRLVIQNPNDTWASQQLGAGTLLYKSEAEGTWDYVGDDPADYVASFEQEAGDEDVAPLIAFLDFVSNADDATFAAELGEHLDVEAFATYLAFQDLVGNTDDIDGPGNNSYLSYDPETGRMTVVNWDLNLAFGGMPGGGMPGGGFPQQGDDFAPSQGGMPELPQGAMPGMPQGGAGGGPSTGNVLAERFRADADFAALVDAATDRLEAELVDSGIAAQLLSAWTAMLERDAGALVDAQTVRSEAATIATALGIAAP